MVPLVSYKKSGSIQKAKSGFTMTFLIVWGKREDCISFQNELIYLKNVYVTSPYNQILTICSERRAQRPNCGFNHEFKNQLLDLVLVAGIIFYLTDLLYHSVIRNYSKLFFRSVKGHKYSLKLNFINSIPKIVSLHWQMNPDFKLLKTVK